MSGMANRTPKTRGLERQTPVMSSFDETTHDASESVRDVIREELKPFIALVTEIHALCKDNKTTLDGLLARERARNTDTISLMTDTNKQAKEGSTNLRNIQEDFDGNQNYILKKQNLYKQGGHLVGNVLTDTINSNTFPKTTDIDDKDDLERLTSNTISETKVKRPEPSPRPRSLTSDKLNARPMLTREQTVIDRKRRTVNNRPVTNERDCLARALQSNIEAIVDDLVFDESELPEQLLADSCVTTDECSAIRKRSRQDQVRILISTIKSRDLCVLKRFVKIVERSNRDLADKMNTAFEENKNSNLSKRVQCPCCELKSKVDIKYVADGLWSIGAISDGLYREICESEKHAGSQEGLWIRMLESINNIVTKDERSLAFDGVLSVLRRKKYAYIADKIENSLHKDKCLSCRCAIVRFQNNRHSEATSTGSSCSPQSSVSIDDIWSSTRSDFEYQLNED